MRRINLTSLVFVIALAIGWWYWATFLRPEPIILVLPNDLRGMFQIRVCSPEVEPTKSNGLEWSIPEDRILCVSSLRPFEPWHTEILRYSDGRIIPYGVVDPEAPVAHWSWRTNGTIWMIVGNKEDYVRALAQP